MLMVDDNTIPLIPRKTFFENANALNPRLSPDGCWLAWIAAFDGVMNVWLAPRDDLTSARPLTRQTDRPIFAHWFARTNAHVLFLKDKDGDENFNLWCVGIDGSAARNLTPYRDVLVVVLGMHRENPHLLAVGMNDRDARWHDVYILDIRTGERRLVYENTDEIASFVLDSRLQLRLATTTRNKGGGSAILKWTGATFEEIMSIEEEDVLNTNLLHLNRAGDAWFLLSTIGRDKAVMLRVDWTTGVQALVACHDKVDIAGWLVDSRTDEVTAVSAEYVRSEWIAVDPAVGHDLAKLEYELDGAVEVESQSDDDTLWVVTAARPDRPSGWHLLDRWTGKITHLFSARPKLCKVKLAPKQGVIISARDRLELVSYLTLPATEAGARPAHHGT
jgi:dipeptidyl aminopeptidase/acylaminoacyl peptidase